MKNQTYRKGWAFILSLAMVFTTLFGGFGFLGIKGMVDEAYAATTTRTTTLDLRSLSTENNSEEGWAWDADTKVLTLSGINLSTASKTGLNLPANTTVVLVGDNRIESTCVGSDGSDGIYSYDGGLSIIGGNSDTLTVTGGASTNSNNSHGINFYKGNLTIDGNVTVTGGTGNSSFGIALYNNGTLSINGGIVNAIGGQGSSSYGIWTDGNIEINGGNVTAETNYSGTGNDIGIRAENMTISSTADVKASGKEYGAYVANTLTMSGIGTKLDAKAQSTNYAISSGLMAKNITISNASLTATGGAVNNANGLSCGILISAGGNLEVNSGTIHAVGGTVDTGTSSGIKASDNGAIDFKGGTISAAAGSTSNRYAVLTDNANKISFGEGPATMVTSPEGGGLSSDGKYIATISGGEIAATSVEIGSYVPGTYTMSASWLPEFASQPVGYVTAPAEQTVTITNTGDQQIILTQPTASKYVIGTLSSTTLAVGGTATFTVQPITGLSVGTHNELIRVQGSGGAAADAYAQFAVKPGVTTTAAISGHAQIYANGNALILAPGTTEGNTVVYLDADRDGVIDSGTDRMAQLDGNAPTAAGYDIKLGWIYGGGYCSDYTGDTQITMLGGYVTNILGGAAKDGYIGGDITGNSKITINGGTVSYIAGTGRAGAVSGTKSIQINGGSIRGNISDYTAGKLTKADGTTPVYKTTLTLSGISVETAVDSSLTLGGVASGYGLNDVKTTSSGELTFYLPIGTATASYDGHNYVAIVDASGNSVFIVITKETTPTASFEASAMTLSNVSSGMKYSTNGGVSWADIAGTSTIVSGVTAANGIQVYKPGNGSTTTDSDTQTITLTKATAPSSDNFTVTQPASIGGTGTIVGIAATMEYSTDNGNSWATGGSTISNIAGGTAYLVRIKASGTTLASDNYSIMINAFSGTKEAKPTASFEASTMTLSNVSSGMKYSTDGGVSWTDVAGTSTVVSGVTAANGIRVYKPGNGSTTTDSDTQAITITKAATPSSDDFNVTQAAAIGGTGTIARITGDMEYSTDSGGSWTDGGSTISNIAGGTTYLVRVKASGTVLASDNYSITISTFSGTKEAKPNASFEASNMTLSNVSSGMKYSTDGGTSWTDVAGTSTVVSGVTAANGIRVYKPGNGSTTTDSDTQTITITKAATPSSGDFDVTQPAVIGGTGTITRITGDMEYSTDSGDSWATGGSTISNIAGGTAYLVRIKASGTTLASDNYSIMINAFSGTKEAKPTASFEASNMTLSNVSSGMKYSTDGGVSWTVVAGTSTVVSGVTAANGIRVYKPGNGSTTTDSDTQTITITKAATPSSDDFNVTQAAAIGGTGTITRITGDMEYSTDSGDSWATGGSTISNIAGGTTYLVRIKASGTTLASDNYSIMINAFSGSDIYTISADTALINFGSQTTGYVSAPASRTVTVTNTGNRTITLTEPATTNTSGNYMIGVLSDTMLDPNDTSTFTLQPKTGLAGGTYNETIHVLGTSGAAASVSAQFSVTAADNGNDKGGSHGGGSTTPPPADPADTPIKFNGKSENAGKTVTSTDGNKTVTTVTLDDAKIQEKMKTEDKGTVVSIPIGGSSDIGLGVLNGQTIKDMQKKESVLEIKTNGATYTLPAAEINIDSVSSQLGKSVELKDIKISVKIAEPSTDTAKIVQNTADKNSYQVVVKPIDFEITCSNGSKTVSVSKFDGYVERTVAIPDGIDPSKVTTGVVLNKDGTFSHVPTTIVKIDGKYYAKINSLTNSTYSVIYNPVEFTDVAKHWAKNSVNNMGSRLVISGVDKNKFEPNRDITRAEFAAIMVRALGLAPDAAKNTYSDVPNLSWYSGYVGTASSYGIINGYDSDTFLPNAKITREQAMAMVARAMTITKLDAAADNGVSSPLAGYTDTAKISSYAKAGIIACLDTGVATGKTADTIAPKNNITRAEVAVIIERLLKKSKLI